MYLIVSFLILFLTTIFYTSEFLYFPWSSAAKCIEVLQYVVMCTYTSFAEKGKLISLDVLCYLHINLIMPFVLLAQWFCIVGLLLISVFNALSWIFQVFSPTFQTKFVNFIIQNSMIKKCNIITKLVSDCSSDQKLVLLLMYQNLENDRLISFLFDISNVQIKTV